mmetsp:Transcript_2300/g.3066  ORF Transcript_2300/g.3066 Transcript_2300/m.3066 type:complete len:166 (-) Transcript_2300:385-882(-)
MVMLYLKSLYLNELKSHHALLLLLNMEILLIWNVLCVPKLLLINKKRDIWHHKKTLEINPRHPIISELNTRVQAQGATDDDTIADLAWLLLDNALMQSGFPAYDIQGFNDRMLRSVFQPGLSVDSLDLVPEIEIPEDDEEDEAGADDVDDLDDIDLSDFAGTDEL